MNCIYFQQPELQLTLLITSPGRYISNISISEFLTFVLFVPKEEQRWRIEGNLRDYSHLKDGIIF